MSRWIKLEETSPSGKTLFRCVICERVSPTPDKTCKTLGNPNGRCDEIEAYLAPRIADKGECKRCAGLEQQIRDEGFVPLGAQLDTRPAPPDEPFPRCQNCGCVASAHRVDDEELRECVDCECKQYYHDGRGATQDKGETCRVCGKAGDVWPTCAECYGAYHSEPDPDCAECEKPGLWEDLHEAVRQKHGHYYAVANDLGEECDSARAEVARLRGAIQQMADLASQGQDALRALLKESR